MTTSSPTSNAKKTKIFEPTLCVTTRRIQIGEDDTADKVTVSELVRKDGLLLNFENFARFQEKGFEKQPVQAGENTYFSEDQNKLSAKVAGYARIDRCAPGDGDVQTLVVSVEPLFRISHDAMKATLAIHPPLPDCRSLVTEDLDQLLAEAGLVFGLDSEQVAKAKAYIGQGLAEFNIIPIATGHQCGPSEDAYLRFELEIGPIAGKLLKDGSIDFRERRIMVPVSDGQLLATKIPVKPGTPGKNVFGEEIEARPGRDITVKTNGEVHFSPEALEVRATNAGVLSVVRGNVLKVSSRQKIDSDIDFAIGNVESKNCLIIRGSVQPGFQVKADGDVEIGGTVSSARIDCHANIVVKGGIIGKKTRISADGDVDILFIEQGRIVCGGTCVIRKQGYYSAIHADEDIRCKRGSVVVGGELVAAGSITLGDVGSDQAAPSLIAAGVVPDRLKLYRQQQSKLVELQDDIIQHMQMQGNGRSRKLRHMEKEAENIKRQLLRMNMIPGTGIYSQGGQGDDPRFSGEEYSADNGIDIRNIGVEVFGSIQAGTTIRIGNRTLVLNKTVTGRLFKLSDNLRRILAVPLARRRT